MPVSITRKASFSRGAIVARGERVEVGAETIEKAECDGQRIDLTHVGEKRKRASQTVPPSIRREVMLRDHGRCRVPGCRCATFVEIHHIRPRSEGGTHDPIGLLSLCGAHHRAVHEGRLFIEGATEDEVVFLHADGTVFGGPLRAETAAASVDARAALRRMGFGESEARSAVATARAQGEALSSEDLLRAALRTLRPRLRASELRTAYRT